MKSKNDLWEFLFGDLFRKLIVEYSIFPGIIFIIPTILLIKRFRNKKRLKEKLNYRDYLYCYVMIIVSVCSLLIQAILIYSRFVSKV